MSKQTKGYRNDLHRLMSQPESWFKPKKRIELPPAAFSNAINNINPKFDFRQWRKSPEWASFIAGYNEAIQVAGNKIKPLKLSP